jgi:predicted dehydrogenase
MSERVFGLGMVGVGGFGRFCLDAFRALPELRVVAVSDANMTHAADVARQYDSRACSFEEMLADPRIDVVHITTPPAFHAQQAIAALHADKHVFCDKPLAITADDSHAVVRAAIAADRRVTVNYVLRQHPLWRLTAEIVRRDFFGRVRRWDQNNCASDERLPADHWFWNESVSGGIFVEHAVHFFDLCNQLVPSPPRTVSSHAASRLTGEQDRVIATVSYEDGTLATFFHSFNRPDVLERSTVRIGLESGYLDLSGWVPESLAIDGLIDPARLDELRELIGAEIEVIDPRSLPTIAFSGGIEVTHGVLVRARIDRPDRMADYRGGIAAGMRDFLRSIANPTHRPRVTLDDGAQSLRLALAARTAAAEQQIIHLDAKERDS